MKRVKPIKRKKAAPPKKAPRVSTSKARANFAGAVGEAQAKHAIVGFERYGKLVAALVPVDAVRLLAGAPVDRPTREAIIANAQLFIKAAPPAKAAKRAPAKKKAAKKKRKTLGKQV